MPGIVSYGAHVPVHRLDGSTVGEAHGARGGRRRRAVACFDEDTTTMGVEAARRALRGAVDPSWIYFATTAPAYQEKTNATAIHAALGLDRSVGASDVGGALRSGGGGLRAALQSPKPALAVLSDLRTGTPGGPEEIESGDAAVAFLATAGDEPVVAELLGATTATDEYTDRWRLPGDTLVSHWEENLAVTVTTPLVADAVGRLLDESGLSADQVDHLVIASANRRVIRAAAKATGIRREAIVADVADEAGVSGVAHAGVLLAATLDVAEPGAVVVVVTADDGVEALALRTTEQLAAHRAADPKPVAAQLAAGRDGLPYGRYLAWRGLIPTEAPRKAAPEGPKAPVAYRRRSFKFGFEASRCQACGERQLPPQRVCYSCKAVDQATREPMREARGTLTAFTIDRLAWSPSGPAVFGIVDFDGGGRTEIELTETSAETLAVGQRVEMTFRLIYTRDGRRNYFWKARPITGEEG